MNMFLEAHWGHGAKESSQEEEALLAIFPQTLQHDLLFEARLCYLKTVIFFSDLQRHSPHVVRKICVEAMSPKVGIDGEVVWASGDACVSMFFVTSGSALYVLGADARQLDYAITENMSNLVRFLESKDSLTLDLSGSFRARDVRPGSSISEPVLWTHWTHCGALVSTDESTAIALAQDSFARVVLGHKGPLCHAVKYARHVCWRMNKYEHIDDLTQFPDLDTIALESELIQGSDYDHILFLSHYKVKAGTEATLLHDAFQEMLRADPLHPANLLRSAIFVDSEDFTNLSGLQQHVKGSDSLVLLLTFFSLIFCLI